MIPPPVSFVAAADKARADLAVPPLPADRSARTLVDLARVNNSTSWSESWLESNDTDVSNTRHALNFCTPCTPWSQPNDSDNEHEGTKVALDPTNKPIVLTA